VEIDKDLESSLQRLGLLNQVAKDITSTLGLEPRLGFVCQSIIDIMGVKGGLYPAVRSENKPIRTGLFLWIERRIYSQGSGGCRQKPG